jgi:hypothetical protein
MPPIKSIFSSIALSLAFAIPATADDYEEAPIFYSTVEPDDAITKLRKQIEAGTFEFDRCGN